MRKGTLAGLLGAALMLIGIFLPLVSIGGLGVSAWDGGMAGEKTAAYLVLGVAVAIGVFSFLANKKHLAAIGTILAGAAGVLMAFVWLGALAEHNATAGMGLYAITAGSILGVVGAVLSFMKK